MKVTPFSKDFDRASFSCEEESLTNYIQKQVSQDIKRGLATCFVLTNDNDQILGYYTLSNMSIVPSYLPEEVTKKLPKADNYVIPGTLLGRLARDISQKGEGIGEFLLFDALIRCVKASKQAASMAILVDPINQNAIDFYKRYGFEMMSNGRMFLMMKKVEKLMSDK